MKKNLFCLLAVGTMVLAACSNENLATKSVSNQAVSALLPQEEAQGRTMLNGLQVVWNTGDAISVFAENGEVYTNNQGTITTGVGETDATFSVTVEGTSKVAAAYPYASANSYNGSVISMTMVDSYTYTENGIGGAPMAALISDQNANIAFKNAGALMGLTVNNIPAGYNKAILTSKGEQAITGACEIAFDTNGNPTLTATSGATGKTIAINFDAAQTKTNKTFYFPIPVANYTELELSISNGTDEKILKTKALNAERSIRYKSTLTLDEVTGSTPVDAANAADATQKLAEGSNSVSVTIPDSDSEPTISLPVSDNQTSLSFEPIPTGKIVTIQATTEGTAVSDQVTISASSDENSSNSFNINLPNSTVTLDANGETATYNEVTASTAENTLIVNKSVTVNTLKVKKGHVRVHGKIGAISREDNSDAVTYIICEDGAEIPSNLGEGFQKMSAAEWDLRKAIANGGTIALDADVELTDYLEIRDVNVVINLNGHTISHSVNSTARYKDVFEVYGTAELTIEGEGNVVAEDGYSVYATGDSKVNLNGGYYFSPVSVVDARKNAIVTINGGEFKVDGTNNSEGDFGQKYTLNLRDKTGNYAGELAAIIVKGGKFYKYNPAESQSENPVANFVAEGYSSVVDGDYFVVKEGVYNETALKAAIASGKTDVTLGANIDLTSSVEVSSNFTVNLNGKSIKCASSDVFVVTAGTLTINGDGLVWGSEDNSSSSCAVWAKGTGKAIINGGTYKVGDDTSNGQTGNWRNDCIYAKEQASIEINGGEFMYTGENPAGHTFLLNLKDSDGATLVVKGGKFHKFNPAASNGENPIANFVAAGYSSVAEGECFLVKDGIYNETALKAAIAAGKTDVTLGADIDLASSVEVSSDFTVNLNGNSIKCKSSDVFVVTAGTLTINGDGLVWGSEDNSSSSCAVWAKGTGKAIINGGTYKVGDDTSNGKTGNWRNDCIYAKEQASIEINGGEFMYTGENPAGHTFLLNLKDSDGATLVVKGGKFHKFNPAASNGENPIANFVAEDCISTQYNEWYVVSKKGN